jgi:uncharacterized protein (TIGR02265 family)
VLPLDNDPPAAGSVLDLDQRVRAVPANAAVRGVFFNMARDALRRRGLEAAAERIETLRAPRRSYLFYPVADMLVAYASAGALIAEDPREGMRAILLDGSRYFAASWFGRSLQRFLGANPEPAIRWLAHSRDHLANYGDWRVEVRRPGYVVVLMVEEYIWIDPWHRAGCEGLLTACGVKGDVQSELDRPFQGRLHVRWSIPN